MGFGVVLMTGANRFAGGVVLPSPVGDGNERAGVSNELAIYYNSVCVYGAAFVFLLDTTRVVLYFTTNIHGNGYLCLWACA